MEKKIKVVFFQRKPRQLANFSVESYFKKIRESLPSEFEVIYYEMPFENRGIFRRFANAICCAFHQGDINHIAGDIHYIALFLKKSKTVLTVLDCGMLRQATGFKKIIFRLFWFQIPALRVKYIIAISTSTKLDLLKYINFDPKCIKVIYICVDEQFVKSEKPFNASKPIILQIGTTPNKNLVRLIPAIQGLDVKLVIIGKVSLDVKELLDLNNIEYTLYERRLSDNEILNKYNDCDIVSFVSTIEGFGMPIVEANCVGRVVITSNIDSMPEVADDAALLVNPFDVLEIRNGIVSLIEMDELRNKLIEKGFKNQKRFKIEELAKQHIGVYKSIFDVHKVSN